MIYIQTTLFPPTPDSETPKTPSSPPSPLVDAGSPGGPRRVDCRDEGFPALLASLRRYVEEAVPYRDRQSPMSPWGGRRLLAARAWSDEMGLSRADLGEVVCHLLLYESSGTRECAKCIRIPGRS